MAGQRPRRRRRVPHCATHRFPHRPHAAPVVLEEDLDPHPRAEWLADDAADRQRDFELERRADARWEV